MRKNLQKPLHRSHNQLTRLKLRTGMSANSSDELNLRTYTVRETTCRCMITATSKTAGTAPATPNAPVVATTGIFLLVQELHLHVPVVATTGMSTFVRELHPMHLSSQQRACHHLSENCNCRTSTVICSVKTQAPLNVQQLVRKICTVWTIPWTCTITGKSTTLFGTVHYCTVSAAARAPAQQGHRPPCQRTAQR